MTDLKECFCKNVKLTDIDGKIWEGYVRVFTPGIHTSNGIDEIRVIIEEGLIGFKRTDIRDIKITNKPSENIKRK